MNRKIIGVTVGTPISPDVIRKKANVFVASKVAPEDTSLLWIDTDDNEASEFPSDEHINALIDAKLGVIENGYY